MKSIYQLDFKVRDYECDLQGIVNNANYQHFYEHTRHEFLIENGISFAKMHNEGIDFVVARVEMAFKTPLKSGDSFRCELDLTQQGVKYTFHQRILRLPDMKVCNTGKFDCVVLDHGKLCQNEELNAFVKSISERKQ